MTADHARTSPAPAIGRIATNQLAAWHSAALGQSQGDLYYRVSLSAFVTQDPPTRSDLDQKSSAQVVKSAGGMHVLRARKKREGGMTENPLIFSGGSAAIRAGRNTVNVVDDTVDLGRLATAAAACAQTVAARNGVRVTELHGVAEHHAVTSLLGNIWRTGTQAHIVSTDLVRAFAHSGNYVAGAYLDGRLIGASVAFFGTGHLHSHVTGVDPAAQGRGVGFALKQHQRWWALSRGIAEIRWTFDPLVRRNAYFNIHKLGASATEYLPEFYGPLTDGLNAGDESDRLYIRWDLASPGAVAAAHGRPTIAEETVPAEAVVLLDRIDERPVPITDTHPETGVALVAVPTDLDALRVRDFGLAASWRRSVREALSKPLAAGYRIVRMRRDGFYVLVRP
jgi:predicted GNAT superfamily acetyltransferase